MNSDIRRKLDMAARVREFVAARVATDPGYQPVLTRLEELLTRAAGILGRQHQGAVAARGASARRRDIRRTLHAQLVHYLVAVGSIAAKDQADLAARFRLPSTNASHAAFLTAVKALLAAGESQKDLLVQAGMSATLLEELTRMVADFEAASEAARTARRDHIGARVDLQVISTDLAQQVKLADGITRYRFGADPEVMAEWKAARRLLGQPRNGEVAPAPPDGEVKDAA
jgi:hypothetical protein